MSTTEHLPSQHGRTIAVTGANSGLGLRTATVLAGAGATVLMTARSTDKLDRAQAEVRTAHPDADLRGVVLDLADLASVERAATQVGEEVDALDVLVNNAGVMLTPEATTADGLELQLGTNHFGHFALTGRLLPLLLAADEARVVTVSSLAHRMGAMDFDDLHQQHRDGYDSNAQYGRSKLANLLFMRELQRRFEAAGVGARSVAAHPGYTATNLQTAGVNLDGAGLYHRAMDLAMRVGNLVVAQDVEQGTEPQLHAAVADVDGGTYWGPQHLRGIRGPVGPATMSDRALDDADARRLWDVSVEATGVDFAPLGATAERDRAQ